MTLVRLEPAAPPSPVKHSTTEPLCSLSHHIVSNIVDTKVPDIIVGVRDITGIPVYRDLGVPRFVSRYAFDCTDTLGKLRQFSEHGLAAFVLSCIFIQISFFILISLYY